MLAAWYLTLRYAICLSKSTNMATSGRWHTTKYFISYLLIQCATVQNPHNWQLIPGRIQWNKNVILTKFSSLPALEVVIVTIPVHPVTKISSKWHLFPFQYKTAYLFTIYSVKITAYHFDRCLSSTDSKMPVKFHSAYDSINTNIRGSKLRKILW